MVYYKDDELIIRSMEEADDKELLKWLLYIKKSD